MMAKTSEPYKQIPVELKEMSERRTSSTTAEEAPEEERFNKEFWLKVQEKVKQSSISWSRAMDEVRAERLVEKHGSNTLLVIIHGWPKKKKYQEKPELIPSLEYLISRLTEIILERDTTEVYKGFRVRSEDDPCRPTLLHLAAAQNFVHVSKCLVDRYPGQMYIWTKKQEGKPSYLPVELALTERKDDTAAYLISQMKCDRLVAKLYVVMSNFFTADG